MQGPCGAESGDETDTARHWIGIADSGIPNAGNTDSGITDKSGFVMGAKEA